MKFALRLATLTFAVFLVLPAPARSQTTGQILGRVSDSESGEPVVAADISIDSLGLRTISSDKGEFILVGIPSGEHRLRIERLGFQTVIQVARVRAGRTTQLRLTLTPLPVELEGIAAEVERLRLIEPDVTITHEVTLGRQLREMPIDDVEDAVELTTGVADGHFRGGRVGQESYLIDGLELKNQFEASTQGPAFEVAPSALEELEVVTGGFGVDNGSALSGVVSYVTRRGNPERWTGRVALSSDFWAPADYYIGFNGLSFSIGGPLRFLGEGATLFADVLAQGKIDAEPRSRGLTCVSEKDAEEDPTLIASIQSLANTEQTAHLYCPFTSNQLPFQRGDKLIGFLRYDQPLSRGTVLMASLLYNRRQNELYSSEFKYNDTYQLGQQTTGWLGSLTLDWSRHSDAKAYHVSVRGSGMRLDRYLGVVDPSTFNGRARVGGFGLGDFKFIGEDFIRSPIEDQLAAGTGVPGYIEPGGTTGSPFGPAAEGIFFTEGTPGLAAWANSGFLGGDARGELLTAAGHSIRAGGKLKFWEIESYERVNPWQAGSSPTFARFFPATADAWAEVKLLAAHEVTIELGFRLDAFRSGIKFQQDRSDFLAPVIDSEWKTRVMPRLGVAVPIPGSHGRTMFRFNYGQISQAPDFSFFLDSTIGDSVRADIRRQGNPNLTFESGTSYEGSVSQLFTGAFSVTATFFLKELDNLVTSSLDFEGFAENQFTTGDFGTVKGFEISLQARLQGFEARAGYALQQAKGVASTAFEDPGVGLTTGRIEFPLAFDRRHSADLTLLLGQAAGYTGTKFGVALTGSVRSGFPLSRTIDQLFLTGPPEPVERLPWQALFNLRVSYDLGRILCARCGWRITGDMRNILFRNNVVALRRDSGTLAPPLSRLLEKSSEIDDGMVPIPAESPDYSVLADLNRDGQITPNELRTARFAAALDREDPTLFFGEAPSLRLGLEFTF